MASTKIKEFFNGRFFEIPKYQRGYAWEIQNIRDLFDDIVESIESNSSHYIGTIVLSKSAGDDETFYVVDGQQRTTTITLVIAALIKQLPLDDAQFYKRFYLKEGDRYRITPLSRDRQFFIDLLEGNTGEPENKSQRFLKATSEQIQFRIEPIEDKLKFLKSVEKLEIMEFIENSEGDAIRIFQTVNDRGKPLSNMEKAKSLLIYFSNRYLNKRLDNLINDYFSDIFEVYDDIKHLGEELGIKLISNRDFNEDNLMRYHFVTFSNENYEPSAAYTLQYLKNTLIKYRNEVSDGIYPEINKFIILYITSLRTFFCNCKKVIGRANSEPKYYKLFVILNLSATLYPLIIKLEKLGLLEQKLTGTNRQDFSFFDLVELIEVRVYKTRGTDPKADMARMVFDIDHREADSIENGLIWFNNRWMPQKAFESNVSGNIYGNQALTYIFISYCESLNQRDYSIEEIKGLVSKTPSIEHILSQTPNFEPDAFGFDNKEDFIDFDNNIGNLTVLERSLNSSAQNKNAADKTDIYKRSLFSMTRKLAAGIDIGRGFTKTDLKARTKKLTDYCVKRWWGEHAEQNAQIIDADSGETGGTVK